MEREWNADSKIGTRMERRFPKLERRFKTWNADSKKDNSFLAYEGPMSFHLIESISCQAAIHPVVCDCLSKARLDGNGYILKRNSLKQSVPAAPCLRTPQGAPTLAFHAWTQGPVWPPWRTWV